MRAEPGNDRTKSRKRQEIMSNFGFRKANTVDEAIALLAEYRDKAVIVAGGTNVMPNIYAKKLDNVTLISIRNIAELKGITCENGVITVGALTTIHEIGKSEVIRENAAESLSRNSSFRSVARFSSSMSQIRSPRIRYPPQRKSAKRS